MKFRGIRKDILILSVIVLLIVLAISGTKVQSVEEYYLTHIDDITEDSEVVSISISCKTVLSNMDKLPDRLRDEKYVPSDGVILEETQLVLRKGDTVFDILQRVTKHNKIQMDFLGADKSVYNSVYVKSINHLYEFSCGPLSGWMFRVNGIFPNHGASKVTLKDGDRIEFLYTCDLGEDLGYQFEGED